ncbi:MAG TPA: hypothetical protein VFB14_20560 [Bryobacteraceae bacterium]|jgi:2-keto-4-pentenoate hydratase/2-oxohepta-3-ene-1,7-dioic acid hydratase in catechol pathway|nr:hypothetical protein [Bryobacteraceae bacterium]
MRLLNSHANGSGTALAIATINNGSAVRGDRIEIAIEGVGVLENGVVEQRAT